MAEIILCVSQCLQYSGSLPNSVGAEVSPVAHRVIDVDGAGWRGWFDVIPLPEC